MWYSKLEVRSYLKKKRKAEQGQTDQECWGRCNVKQGFGVDLKEVVTAAKTWMQWRGHPLRFLGPGMLLE